MYKGRDMPVKGAAKKNHQAMMECTDVSDGDHHFGGTEYKLGKREIGHIHGDFLIDIPFPSKVRNAIIDKAEAEPHQLKKTVNLLVSSYLFND
jgi:Luciferase